MNATEKRLADALNGYGDATTYISNLSVLLDKAVEELLSADRESISGAVAAIDRCTALMIIARDSAEGEVKAMDARAGITASAREAPEMGAPCA
ncbi:hypothetical protein [Microbaculum marinisediminis]|uniref:Uncharacterized protein n=1 Tax=Microbaculum marinisediminis TaxID=2931392 RepID=A0AAW5QW39_9HYPH|nr:hypothetical protein [Microbaculum sp. A6E488]MCT8970883.1 hypothetical protein [Microbaculum sp. A6E488]